MNNKFKKLITLITLTAYLFGNAMVPVTFAQEAPPAAPEAPAAPAAPEAPSAPQAPGTPSTPTQEDLNNTENDAAEDAAKAAEEAAEDAAREQRRAERKAAEQAAAAAAAQTSSGQQSSAPVSNNSGQQTGDQKDNGNSGDTAINTGSATNNAGLTNAANSNLGSGTGILGGSSGASIINDGNGSGSTNGGSASIINNSTTNQNNSASVLNNLNQSTTTGENESSKNTGGDTNITTGDANTTGTIINSLNTNMAGVAVAEFNINDNHTGDIILDFAAGCISNCGGSSSVANTGNGADSINDANLDITNNSDTFQNNDATVENNMTLVSNSGDNIASKNTDGDSTITTGDANVSANVLTFANNNVSGNVVYTVVNIFGDLIGDIIMPEEYLAAAGGCTDCPNGSLAVANTGNGADSTNNANLDLVDNNQTFQTNDANIENNLIINGSTAGNSASKNTDGNSDITTGNVNVDAQVLNVANSNIDGGNWWLVIVNEGGKWIGKIMGAPEGSNMAGSAGTEFVVDENGEITAINSGNGAGSENNSNISQTNNQTTTQNNSIDLVNNVNLTANTGNNNAEKNTGGNSKIVTGDANIVANMVNFVNNNITGGGKLFVTVVNVIGGTWLGDFISPGEHKDENKAQGALAQENTQEEEEEVVEEEETSAGSTTKKVVKKKIAAQGGAEASYNGQGFGGAISGAVGGVSTAFKGFKDNSVSDDLLIAESANKKIKINLAYIILLLPLAGLIILSRAKRQYLTALVRARLESANKPGMFLGSILAVTLFILNKFSS